MTSDLKPQHVARVLAMLSAVPVFWIFAVQGVTTTTTVDYATGDLSSESDLGAQIGKAFIFLLLTAGFGLAAWYTRKTATPWPPGIQQKLAEIGLSPQNDPGTRERHEAVTVRSATQVLRPAPNEPRVSPVGGMSVGADGRCRWGVSPKLRRP